MGASTGDEAGGFVGAGGVDAAVEVGIKDTIGGLVPDGVGTLGVWGYWGESAGGGLSREKGREAEVEQAPHVAKSTTWVGSVSLPDASNSGSLVDFGAAVCGDDD